ncbi:hypothetical protein OIU76_024627 [Salix suchowensis]|nr:hypothetical protein OIU76_024627 [Salix suchowensis]
MDLVLKHLQAEKGRSEARDAFWGVAQQQKEGSSVGGSDCSREFFWFLERVAVRVVQTRRREDRRRRVWLCAEEKKRRQKEKGEGVVVQTRRREGRRRRLCADGEEDKAEWRRVEEDKVSDFCAMDLLNRKS